MFRIMQEKTRRLAEQDILNVLKIRGWSSARDLIGTQNFHGVRTLSHGQVWTLLRRLMARGKVVRRWDGNERYGRHVYNLKGV